MKLTANQIDVHVGHRMRLRREFLGISQGRLGRHLGLTFSQVQKYEKGANRIGAGRLYLISEFLGVPVQYFFEELGEQRAEAEGGRVGRKGEEMTILEEAFLSIGDVDTRRSVLALVRSLAGVAENNTSAGNDPRL